MDGLAQTKTLLTDILEAAQRLRDALNEALAENAVLLCELLIAENELAAYIPIAQEAAALRAALAPFAALSDAPYPDDAWVIYHLRLADVRRARKALGEGK